MTSREGQLKNSQQEGKPLFSLKVYNPFRTETDEIFSLELGKQSTHEEKKSESQEHIIYTAARIAAKFAIVQAIPGKLKTPIDVLNIATGKNIFNGKELTTQERIVAGTLLIGKVALIPTPPPIRIAGTIALVGAEYGYELYKNRQEATPIVTL